MTRPNDVLRAMFEHHLWATERLIDHLARLPAERLDASVPGTYGSTIDTLTHLVDADGRYLMRLREPTPPPGEDRTGIPLATLKDEIADHRRRWDVALAELERGELHSVIRNHHGGYPDTDPAETMLLIQAIHHGNDHRTQICSTLGALGEEVPELDGWEFWVDVPHATTE
jgi:uncharacterized damage-inducible protein DinB